MKRSLLGLLALILLLFGASIFLVMRGVDRATQPVAELQSQVATQMAQFLHPTPTVRPDPVTIVHAVRQLARLESIQYAIEKVITAETGQGPFGFLFGDRLLFVAHGTVTAGVDLAKIEAKDIDVDETGRVTIRMPQAEIFNVTLENEKSYVYDRDIGLLRRGDVQLETAARVAAEQAIREAALEDGILEQAQVNAENVITRLLLSVGLRDVVFLTP